MIRDETGILFLDYNQPLWIINKVFALFKSPEYFNKTVKDYGRSDGMSDTYCAQGMGSDDSYVYFPMSPIKDISTDNVLVVYGWDGKYIDTLHLPITYESETMFYAAGDYYIVFNRGGASLYRLIPVISFDPSK